MKLTREFFVDEFRQVDNETLLQRIVANRLSDVAREAAAFVLAERGVVGEQLERDLVGAAKSSIRTSSVTNQCDHCGASVALGAVHDEGQKFCNTICLERARLDEIGIEIPGNAVRDHARSMRFAPCPRCGVRDNTVEARATYTVVSYLTGARSDSGTAICCRRCGARHARGAAIVCALVGWWSLPGLFLTPAAIVQNLRESRRLDGHHEPTPELMLEARRALARRLLAERRGAASAAWSPRAPRRARAARDSADTPPQRSRDAGRRSPCR